MMDIITDEDEVEPSFGAEEGDSDEDGTSPPAAVTLRARGSRCRRKNLKRHAVRLCAFECE